MERWKPVIGYEGVYEVSTRGRVKSLERTFFWGWNHRNKKTLPERIMKLRVIPDSGYVKVCLSKDGLQTDHLVHRLVAISFIPNPDDMPEVNHKDLIKTNNVAWNLEWSTPSGNVKHSYKNGARTQKGENNNGSVLTEKDVIRIKWRLERGDMQLQIARDFGIDPSHITQIKQGRLWSHVQI